MTIVLFSHAASLRSWLSDDDYRCLVVALSLIWGVLDTASTYGAVLAHNTTRHEINPLVRAVLEIDIRLFVPLKLCGVCLAAGIALRGQPLIETVTWWRKFFYAHIGVATVVVITNTIMALLAL